MSDDEKVCSECAEVIKLEAKLCKHCGHKFSDAEVAEQINASARDARSVIDEKLDAALARAIGPHANPSKLSRKKVKLWQLEFKARGHDVPLQALLARAKFHRMVIDTKPAPALRSEWSNELRTSIDGDIRARQDNGVVSRSDCVGMADQHNVYDLEDRILELKLSYVDYKGDIIDRKARQKEAAQRDREAQHSVRADPTSTSARDNQYGVLQGPANLIGGCFNMWVWAILLFFVAALVVAIFS